MSFENATGTIASSRESSPSSLPSPGHDREVLCRQAALHSSLRVRTAVSADCQLWVGTDLTTFTPDCNRQYPEDVVRGSKAFRRLSPDYFLWLEARFAAFRRKTNQAGQLPPEAKEFAERFQRIQQVVKDAYPSSALEAARTRLSQLPMESPNKSTGILHRRSEFVYPSKSTLPVRREVTYHALGEVDAIRDEALALGWTEDSLYGTRGRFAFPCGPGYGVICFIHDDQRIGKVSDRTIQLRCSGGHSLHFYRREVNHV